MKIPGLMWRPLATAVTCLVLLQHPVAGRTAESSAQMKESFTDRQCLSIVKKVIASGRYTEESIAPLCAEAAKAAKCDFFAEALSLASSHPDFDSERFCLNMEEARFCSESMDRLLSSEPIADLAYGECLRARPAKNATYCQRFQNMLSYAVRNDDLDTMRACYMIEAYANVEPPKDAPKESEATPDSPKTRIITSGGKELVPSGQGSATGASPQRDVGKPSIVLQPKPFEYFGNGSGTMVPSAPEPMEKKKSEESKPEAIIVPPVPLAALSRGAKVKDAGKVVVTQKPVLQAAATARVSLEVITGRGGADDSLTPQLGVKEEVAPRRPTDTDTAARPPVHEGAHAPKAVLMTGRSPPIVSQKAPNGTVTPKVQGAAPVTAVNGSATQGSALNGISKNGSATNGSATIGSATDDITKSSSVVNRTTPGKAPIVRHAVPLTPVPGRLRLHAVPDPLSVLPRRARTGLAQGGVVRHQQGALGRKAGEKKDWRGEYNGFLSKFVQ